MRVRILLLLAAASSGLPAAAFAAPAKRPLTLEMVTADPPLARRGPIEMAWRDAERLTFLLPEGINGEDRSALYEVDARTGRRTTVATPITEGGVAVSLAGAEWSPDGSTLLLKGSNDLWLLEPATKKLRRLTHDEEKEEVPALSPDGRRVAYVKRHDLYTLDLASGQETRLTSTGADHVLNGVLDWVYEEELANRKSRRAFAWSPDSASIAYLRLDENRVPEMPIVDFTPPHGTLVRERYPKAGDPNAIPSVHIVALAPGTRPVDVVFPNDDLYVGWEITWTPDSKAACYVTLDRAQTRLQAVLLPRDGAPSRTLVTETDRAWVNSIEPPRFLKDGSGFLFLSERTGFVHLYRYAMDGTLRNAVTSGDWFLEESPEVDETNGFVTFTGTEKDPRERHVYRVRLDGTSFTRLSNGRGRHAVRLSPGGAYYADTVSDIETPPKTLLRRADGSQVAVVDDVSDALAGVALGTTELSSFKGRDGTLFYTRLVRPANFDPARRYPVVVFVYGGPHSQVVEDRWGATSLFDQLLASRGFLVWSIDNRGSWGRGHAFETPILRHMGEVELKDQLEGIAELKKLPFVDPARIGIWGWSYGGFLTLYAATHAGETFRCAVAGAPVADWRLYDSIYTERYMKLPKENGAGYDASAPLTSAARLGTKLLILHGTSDDNVHMQNSILFTDALARARKDYAFVPLLRQKHSPKDPALKLYVNQRILEFFERNL